MTLSPTIARSMQVKAHDQFQEEMEKQAIAVENLGENVMKAVARKTLGRLISRSPVLTGNYVTNHQVSGGTASTKVDLKLKFSKEQSSRKSAAGTAIGKGFSVIGRLKNPTRIVIKNTVYYAHEVEFGWNFGRGRTAPGYFVYHHTAADMLEMTPGIIAEEEAKHGF